MAQTIAVIDYGMGNLRSVANAMRAAAPHVTVITTADTARIKAADRVIFPGQGAMPDCMREMTASGLREAVEFCAATKPFLGICVGMQLLFDVGAEGNTPGLGIFKGTVPRFPPEKMVGVQGEKLKVPHMGWNEVQQDRPHPLWNGIADGERFYFIHSFYPQPMQASECAAHAHYPFAFTCAVARANLFGVQFHPEKSHRAGLKLLSNFAHWNPSF
jgi:imidazole glycerol-phosphate synthase subunit HisH